jgi:hypothetical protein
MLTELLNRPVFRRRRCFGRWLVANRNYNSLLALLTGHSETIKS